MSNTRKWIALANFYWGTGDTKQEAINNLTAAACGRPRIVEVGRFTHPVTDVSVDRMGGIGWTNTGDSDAQIEWGVA